jgi:hypothetical protein
MTNYSYRALWNLFTYGPDDSWIRLCDNDCGAKTYFDVPTGKVRNAEVGKDDSNHGDTCSRILWFKTMGAGMNWIPSYLFEEPEWKGEDRISLNKILGFCLYTFNEKTEIYLRAKALKDKLDAKYLSNEITKREWDASKKARWEAKKLTAEWQNEVKQQKEQWQRYLQKEGLHPPAPLIEERGRRRGAA